MLVAAYMLIVLPFIPVAATGIPLHQAHKCTL